MSETIDIIERLHRAAEAKMRSHCSPGEIPKEWPGTLELDAALEVRHLRTRIKELETEVDNLMWRVMP